MGSDYKISNISNIFTGLSYAHITNINIGSRNKCIINCHAATHSVSYH